MSEIKLRTWQRRVNECKKKHRPKLLNWERDGFGNNRENSFNELKSKYLEENRTCIQRISANDLSVERFIEEYERVSIPVIISDIPTVENWNAVKTWNFDSFKHLKNRYFKVGEDDDGYSVKLTSLQMRLKYFLKYLHSTTDDSPLYIFDSRFENDSIGKSLLSDYCVPKYFPEDLFQLVGEKKRPPYRWFLIGPARSGTTIHIDPLGTSAWNTILQGIKLWVLFPPHTNKRLVKALDVIQKEEDDESINYFVDYIPRLQEKYPQECQEMKICYQYPGETVFVPGGWWHAVLNLEHSIAITHNYCSHQNFERVWIRTKKGRKKLSIKWKKLLSQKYPELSQIADMWDNIDVYNNNNNKNDNNTTTTITTITTTTSSSTKKEEKDENKKKRKFVNNDKNTNNNNNDNDSNNNNDNREDNNNNKRKRYE